MCTQYVTISMTALLEIVACRHAWHVPKTLLVDYYYYITLPLQGRHKHLASRSIHMDCIRILPGHLAGH